MTAQLQLPSEVNSQIKAATEIIRLHLSDSLLAIQLFGSCLEGGLMPLSDIDFLVVVNRSMQERERKALLLKLLEVSSAPGVSLVYRPLEVTVVSYDEVVPWRHPAKRELQFGEWLRADLGAGIFEPVTPDIDLAILLRKVIERSVPLWGPAAHELLDAVPDKDFYSALKQTLMIWNEPKDWLGDERNIVLTLARIYYSAETGRITSKQDAAARVLELLPASQQALLQKALDEHRSGEIGDLVLSPAVLAEFIYFMKDKINAMLISR